MYLALSVPGALTSIFDTSNGLCPVENPTPSVVANFLGKPLIEPFILAILCVILKLSPPVRD